MRDIDDLALREATEASAEAEKAIKEFQAATDGHRPAARLRLIFALQRLTDIINRRVAATKRATAATPSRDL